MPDGAVGVNQANGAGLLGRVAVDMGGFDVADAPCRFTLSQSKTFKKGPPLGIQGVRLAVPEGVVLVD